MDLERIIAGRRSIRKYTAEQVPDEFIEKLVQMAIEAPSPGNKKSWHFYIIRNSLVLKDMAGIVESELENLIATAGVTPESLHGPRRSSTWFKEAPVVIAVTTKRYRSRIDRTLLEAGYAEEEVDSLRCRPDLQSLGAVIQNMLLTAHANGYGTCWLTGPMVARKQLEEYLGVKSPEIIAALVALGRPEYSPPRPQTNPLEEFITFR